jgi:pantoate--beta-alanine ligase
MHLLTTLSDLHAWRQRQANVALVPTMGALHAGHTALIEKALTLTDTVVVSIFVNPTQFGPKEDLSRYPRTLDADLALCRQLGVSAIFMPTVAEMYPDGLQTAVVPPQWLTHAHCGLHRPGHFTGVATIVLKLFALIQPRYALFGAKDAQQQAIIQHMITDLNLPVDLVEVSTVREADGLALSSRNRYLTTPTSRKAALVLVNTLQAVNTLLLTRQAEQGPSVSVSFAEMHQVQAELLNQALTTLPAHITWDYLHAVCVHTFKPADILKPGVRLLGAIHVTDGNNVNVRLIDNWVIGTNLKGNG